MARYKDVRWDELNKDDTPLEKLALEFEVFNRAEGKTQNTVDWYKSILGLFIDYLKDQRIKPILKNVNIGVVREYILHLQGRKRYEEHPHTPKQEQVLSPMSINGYVRATKTFFNWLYKEGYTEEHRLERLKIPKAPRKLIEPLSEAEIALVLSAIDPQTSWGARNITIVLMYLDTGLRLSELVTLPMNDLHLEEGRLKVMGKGQKERIVPFGSSVQKALMKYIFHFRPETLNTDRVFLNLDGSQMTATGLKLLFRRLAIVSGVNRLHVHLLRHTFAVNYLMNGGDVFTLQLILGHTTLEMVRRYINLANAHVIAQHKQFSPVDRMNMRQIKRAIRVGKKSRIVA